MSFTQNEEALTRQMTQYWNDIVLEGLGENFVEIF